MLSAGSSSRSMHLENHGDHRDNSACAPVDTTPQGASGPASCSFQSIPIELLVYIFLQLKTRHYRKSDALPPYHWLVITHVCREWRQIALEAAELWTHLFTLRPACLRTFLTRSQQAPLYVMCFKCRDLAEMKQQPCLEALKIILPEFPRVAYFSMLTLGTYRETFGDFDFPLDVPVLKEMYFGSILLPEERRPIQQFFTCAPALESLSLSWSSPVYLRTIWCPRLINLHIPSCHGIDGLTVTAWANILASMPLLQTFTLCDTIYPPDVPSAGTCSSPIHLPHLKLLRLNNNGTGSIRLLELLSTPALEELHYTALEDCAPGACRCTRTVEAIQAKVIELTHHSTPQWLHVCCQKTRICLLILDAPYTGTACTRLAARNISTGTGCHAALTLHFATCKPVGDMVERFSRMLTSVLPLPELRTLELIDCGDHFLREWALDPPCINLSNDFFDRASNIRTLLLSCSNPAKYLGDLLHAAAVDQPVRFPHLESVGIQPAWEYWRAGARMEVIDVRSILQQRKDSGHAIEHLHVCSAPGAVADAEELKASGLLPSVDYQ
ncbi:hypothetical protein NM688_g4259 [Phlebia brevispora]|uniref:Uncharacterized protein n=1 Tax=Phlebia brevispora TaxID=194682 RepID=A0ACC1T3M0_9APHY|nr:hypothetical protein NM688_g4259 [Phlebia brevispora]